jgi:large subunit ribosomal protein L21
MYAVFEDGSRQYLVSEGDVLRVDFRSAEIGSTVEFDRVLLYRNEGDLQIGQPVITGARIVAEVVDHPSEKFYIQHFRRRKNYRRFKGHRQPFTQVEILHILRAGEKPQRGEEREEGAGAKG